MADKNRQFIPPRFPEIPLKMGKKKRDKTTERNKKEIRVDNQGDTATHFGQWNTNG